MLLEVKAGNPGLAPAPYKDIFIFTGFGKDSLFTPEGGGLL